MNPSEREKRDVIVRYTKDLCYQHGCELLYLTIMGSRLYGTSTPASDWDVKGVMLPDSGDVLCGRHTHNIRLKEDQNYLGIDLEIYSIQKYFKLLRSGETITADMLFAPTYPEAILFVEHNFSDLFSHYKDVINGKDLDKNPYLRYAYSQAIKYGVKGNRFGVVQKVLDLAETLYESNTAETHKLGDFLTALEMAGGNPKYCFVTEVETHRKQKVPGLYLAGKVHQGTIKLGEFVKRCKTLLSDYGERTKLAANAGGNDWKALSHAVRAVGQLLELVRTGMIRFPRSDADDLLQIKRGEISFETVRELLETGIQIFDEEVENGVAKTYRWRQKYVDNLIIKIYNDRL